jgi:hypothetical protein
VRPLAEVDQVAVLVERDVLARGDRVEDLELVPLAQGLERRWASSRERPRDEKSQVARMISTMTASMRARSSSVKRLPSGRSKS